MKKSIDYYLSLISPWSYLGHERLVSMANSHGIPITIWPVDYSVIFPSTGGTPLPKRSDQRKAYRMQELQRWRDHLQIELNLEPKHFPVNDKPAAIMVVNLRQQDSEAAVRLAGACLKACWVEERDISDTNTLLAIAEENNLDGNALLNDKEGALAVIAEDSTRALESGVFGAPSYRFNGQLYWGQDRLEFLQRELEQSATST